MASWRQFRRAYGLTKTTLEFTRLTFMHIVPRWTSNLVRDLNARRVGLCNDAPWPDHGGYNHWRCKRLRRHDGKHRFNSYTWTDDTEVEYAPQDLDRNQVVHAHIHLSHPHYRWNDRHMQDTIRQALAWRKIVRHSIPKRGVRDHREA